MTSAGKLLRIMLPIAFWAVMTAGTLSAQEAISLVGSGSNMMGRLYNEWMTEYGKLHPKVQVRYLPLGTAQSIKEIRGGSGDFGAGEIPLADAQKQGGKYQLIEFPTALVAIVPIYKLPSNPELRFSGEVLADIYLGNIKNWKDSRIAKLNPGVSLPDLAITVIHLSGVRGSNYILTDFLSKSSEEWKTKIGKSASPKWPVGEDATRSDGMATQVSGTPGAIGYVELSYAKRTDIGYGSVQNAAGQFVKPTPGGIVAACTANESSMPEDFKISLANSTGKESYPLVSFTWIYAPTSGLDPERSRALKDFWTWALSDGQEFAARLGYTPLPASVALKARQTLNSIQ